ncbi:chromosomal replication initiator protein DnaA [Candidatus Sumerlaeota bacterium]|nr:chromosomal replication initiator protein DnaA [Candidatus Sumerlaeota bacterium]
MNLTVDADALWEKTLERLSTQIDPEILQTWFVPTTAHTFQDQTLTLTVPSRFYINWLTSNHREIIQRAVEDLVGAPVQLAFCIRESEEEADVSEPQPQPAWPGSAPESRLSDGHLINHSLNSRYTFDRFVIGESNRFAHAAAVSVADPHRLAYNPLFIYGGVGLGKTHLMQAIGHQLLASDPSRRVLYVTSEQFMNTFIDAISSGRQMEFRQLYRTVDLLLIDDIQFFTGKERTQTEFFHTFNALYGAEKKIVVSSDRPPKEIKTLEERLVSRFEWGLIVDIQAPDLETRVAILKRKAEMEGMDVPNDVTLFIAEHIRSNIRELEGSLLRVKAFATMENRPIDLNMAKQVLGSLLVSEAATQRITIERIQEIVCEYFEIKPTDIVSESRLKKFATPRHIAQYLCRQLTEFSYPEIGQRFGGRDHTSVMHAVRKIEKDLERDSNMKNIISYLIRRIRES